MKKPKQKKAKKPRRKELQAQINDYERALKEAHNDARIARREAAEALDAKYEQAAKYTFDVPCAFAVGVIITGIAAAIIGLCLT